MSLAGFLRQIVEVLDDAGIPYMLTGSLASAYYAAPRATQDVDLVIDAGAAALGRAVAGFREAGFYVDRGAAMEALESHGQFNAIDGSGGWKVDLIIRKDRVFGRTEFERRETATLLGVEVSLASLEDFLSRSSSGASSAIPSSNGETSCSYWSAPDLASTSNTSGQ